jgi:hypothetical protein
MFEVGNQNLDVRILQKALDRIHAARRRHHLAAEVLQHVRGNFQDEGIIIDYQYCTRHFELPADLALPRFQRHSKASVPASRLRSIIGSNPI